MNGLRENVVAWIKEFSGSYCRTHGKDIIWRAPLVGLGDARSPLFPEIRKIGNRAQKMPQDYMPEATTVISYFLPFREDIVEGNAGGDMPTFDWADAYTLTNTMAVDMNRYIASKVEDLGYRAVVPEDAGVIVDRTYSCWSQRHVARIAGLGSFGMNNMLITESGCCGRYFSVITDVPCDHDAPFIGERCLHKIDGSCGMCMMACPCDALSDDAFDRDACEAQCSSNAKVVSVTVCGKCSAGMPCAFRDPSA